MIRVNPQRPTAPARPMIPTALVRARQVRVGTLVATLLAVTHCAPLLASTPSLPPAAVAAAPSSAPSAPMSQFLFRFSEPNTAAQWFATDDRVMGGISRSRLRADAEGHAVFEGVMSLERNGGFASVRAEAAAPTLPKVTDYVVAVRGDGKRYKLTLRVAGRFSQVSYQASFQTVKEQWITVALPVSSFEPSFRGRRVLNAPPVDPTLVDQIGLMIADKQDGPFQLAIRSISVESR